MHSFFTLRRIVISSIFLIAFGSGCTRISSTDIGSGLIPAIDGVNTRDTLLDVITDSFEDTDSTRIYKGDNHLLGTITNDPIFGKTTASMFFELKPGSYPYYIPGNKDSLVVDSAVLIVSYRGFYGDSTQPLRLNVFEIDKNTPLNIFNAYPANYAASHNFNLVQSLGNSINVDIRRMGDSVKNRYEDATNQIRFRLNASVAKRFLKDYDSTNAYISDSAFRTYFAGFAITANTGTSANALLKINLADTNTKFALYYSSSSTGATKRDTSVAYLKFSTSYSGDANLVLRDRSGSDAAKHLTTTAKPDSLVYVQTTPGTYVRIKIPGLQSMSNRIIHRAELITEQVPDDANLPTIETQMLPPKILLLTAFDSARNSKRNIPNDYILSSSGANTAAFGGYLVSKSVPGYDRIASYTFDISRYIQGIVTRKDTSFTLRLSAPSNDSLLYTPPYPGNTFSQTYYMSPSGGNDVGDGRIRLGGGSHTRFRMRLRIIFSRI
ncbi:MAG: DUF4270 domain-containing protein [Chitinophagaceae bacterium]|nr:DUF4270 domain-containing protein [Chitinophagaceae bacterium]MDP1763777.1 DUF4270 family protein [Sediminibacterium sp.]MDP1811519.1 DUF4270 family protein [Sediminibacterium sp.]MDP3127277.1 DUF4270 family protein [Sediminibacterium sp.]MDP3666568.1 DUF4270 family protein [Sediminibacterium sp.]